MNIQKSGAPSAIVYIVDDHAEVSDSLFRLLSSIGIYAETFDSISAFQAATRPAVPSCLILDLQLSDGDGLELQARMRELGDHIPIVVVTGFGDIRQTVKAMKAGAIDFLEKPISEQRLLDSVHRALESDVARRAKEQEFETILERYRSLTAREQQVIELIASGCLNKEVAEQLGISEVTVKAHRASAYRKMQARSFAQLVQMIMKVNPRVAAQSPQSPQSPPSSPSAQPRGDAEAGDGE